MGRISKNSSARGSFRKKKDNIKFFKPQTETTLLSFIIETIKDQSRTTLKSLLAHNQIAVNGKPTKQFNFPIKPTDEVGINFDRPFNYFKSQYLHIMYEDDSIIVIDKSSGLLSMGTDRIKEKTAYHILSEYVKKNDLRNKIFIVHRLDKETSGVMIFAKSAKAQLKLQQDWDNVVLDRKYVAIVEGTPDKPTGELRSYLAENSAMNVYSTDEDSGKLAITQYKVLNSKGRYSLVELTLLTGKKNQIRVHMSEFGYPLAGDKKYGASTNPAKRLMLHATKIQFIHPVTRENLTFESPVPAKFKMVMNL